MFCLKWIKKFILFRYLDDLLALGEDEVTLLLADEDEDTSIPNYLAQLTAATNKPKPPKGRGFFRFTMITDCIVLKC